MPQSANPKISLLITLAVLVSIASTFIAALSSNGSKPADAQNITVSATSKAEIYASRRSHSLNIEDWKRLASGG